MSAGVFCQSEKAFQSAPKQGKNTVKMCIFQGLPTVAFMSHRACVAAEICYDESSFICEFLP